MGSKNGDIQINYLDEEIKPADKGSKPNPNVKIQGKLKHMFNFNKPKRQADEELLLKLLHRNQDVMAAYSVAPGESNDEELVLDG